MNTQKGFANILIIILGLLVVGGGSYVYLDNKQEEPIAGNHQEELKDNKNYEEEKPETKVIHEDCNPEIEDCIREIIVLPEVDNQVESKNILPEDSLPKSIELTSQKDIIDFFGAEEDSVWYGPNSISSYELDDGFIVEAQSGVMFVSFISSAEIEQIEEVVKIIKDNDGIIVGRTGETRIKVFVNTDEGLEKLCNLVDLKEYSSCILNMTTQLD